MSDKIVYSTDPGFRQPAAVRLSFRRGGKGKGMTVVEGLHISETMKEKLLKTLKQRLGCGGTIKEGALEIQGDRRDFMESFLQADGYKVKRVGG